MPAKDVVSSCTKTRKASAAINAKTKAKVSMEMDVKDKFMSLLSLKLSALMFLYLNLLKKRKLRSKLFATFANAMAAISSSTLNRNMVTVADAATTRVMVTVEAVSNRNLLKSPKRKLSRHPNLLKLLKLKFLSQSNLSSSRQLPKNPTRWKPTC